MVLTKPSGNVVTLSLKKGENGKKGGKKRRERRKRRKRREKRWEVKQSGGQKSFFLRAS